MFSVFYSGPSHPGILHQTQFGALAPSGGGFGYHLEKQSWLQACPAFESITHQSMSILPIVLQLDDDAQGCLVRAAV